MSICEFLENDLNGFATSSKQLHLIFPMKQSSLEKKRLVPRTSHPAPTAKREESWFGKGGGSSIEWFPKHTSAENLTAPRKMMVGRLGFVFFWKINFQGEGVKLCWGGMFLKKE